MAMILSVDTVAMSCWRISILQRSEAIRSISAAFVKTIMICRLPRGTVATGLHADEAVEITLSSAPVEAVQRRDAAAELTVSRIPASAAPVSERPLVVRHYRHPRHRTTAPLTPLFVTPAFGNGTLWPVQDR